MKETYEPLQVQVLTVLQDEEVVTASPDQAHDNAYTNFDDLFRR